MKIDWKLFDDEETIIDEKDKSPEEICSDLKNCLVEELKNKQSLPTEQLLEERYNKFRKIGAC